MTRVTSSGENIQSKFSFNSTNNLNYKKTLPEFIAGEQKKEIETTQTGHF
jgi:hypothetical protein